MATSGIAEGTVLGEVITLERPVAKTRAWVHWRGQDADYGAVDVYLLSREALPFVEDVHAELVAEAAAAPATVCTLVRAGEERGRPWFATRAPRGESLASWAEARGSEPPYGDVHDRMIPLLDVLASLHGEGRVHGALSIRRVFVNGASIELTESVLGRLEARVAAVQGEEASLPFGVAPEMRTDSAAGSTATDVWSFGAMMAALLSGTEPTLDGLSFLIEDLDIRFSSDGVAWIRSCLEPEELMRPANLRELRKAMRDALVAVRMTGLSDEILGPGPGVGGGPRRPAADADPFAGLDLLPGAGSGEGGHWLYAVGGVDYGPVNDARILALLYADEIDEFTDIVDTRTQSRAMLQRVPDFAAQVAEYIPKRTKRRADQAERRERIVTEAKRTSRTTVLAGAFAVFALAALAWFTRADAEALPLDALVIDFGFRVDAPQPEYQSIAADGDLLAALFNFSDPLPPPPPEPATRRRTPRPGAGGADGVPTGDGDNFDGDYVLSFDSSRPPSKLSNDQINGTVRANLGAVRPCLESEMRSNPGFRGARVNWSIHPNGRTFNVNASGMGSISDDAERCLVRAFRSMRFPEFNDVPMSVSFPFTIQ